MRTARRSSRVLSAAAAFLLFVALPLVAPFGARGIVDAPTLSARQLPSQVIPPDTTAQGKKILTIDDYALWRSVGSVSLSPDGRWVTYVYSRREVDDSLHIEPLGEGEGKTVRRGGSPSFSADSRWVAYYINPPERTGGQAGAAGGAAARGGAGGAAQARALELLDLQTMDTVRWENIQAFAFAEEGNALVLKKRAGDSDADYEGTDLLVRYLGDGTEDLLAYVNEWGLDERGTRLAYTVDGPGGEYNGVHLLDLATRSRRVLDSERKAAYARLTWGDEKRKPSFDALAVLKGTEDEKVVETANALLAWPNVSVSTTPVVLDPRPVKADSATAADTTSGRASQGNGSGAQARVPDPFPDGWVLSEKGTIRWAPDAGRLFVATRPQVPAPREVCKPAADSAAARGRSRPDSAAAGATAAALADTASAGSARARPSAAPKIVNLATRVDSTGRPLGPEEVENGECPEFVADVDIWHVQDAELQSVQMVRASRDRNQTYMGVVHVEGRGADRTLRYVQLADTTMESVQVSDNGRYAMGNDDRPYQSDWEPSYADYYRLDLSTGERTLVLEKHLRTLGFSPRGDDFLYWKDAHVWKYNLRTGEHTNLTQNAPVTFVNEEFDRWGEKPLHGIAGWTADSSAVILEHRYDLYLQRLDGRPATPLTEGKGAEGEIQLRLVDLEPDEDLVDLSKPQVLTAFGQWTKKDGFYRLRNARIQEMVMADARFGGLQKADSTDLVIFTREDFETFPDYWVAGLDLAEPRKVTDANPQQAEYNWGRRILFDYWTEDGVHLQGTLAIPYDYVEGQKRPMLINYYEKNSQNLHSYPGPGYRSSPNFAGYVSAGYLVMQPDIRFLFGDTHSQMLECINLAVDKVIEMGYVDPERIGVHGHSFSGQGSAYIATHSDRFAAIVAGAAASNLVSDFNQLWKSSGSNQHGYDTYGQGRFATNPYDDFELFVSQSATQNADDMHTPLLLLHGTDDGSVEWLQAVEFYNGVRWNGGDVILLSYPGEAHGLRQYENQKDFQIRMRQFFDHYLWDRPAPRWMTDGRLFLQKERDRAMMQRGGNGGGSGAARPGGGG